MASVIDLSCCTDLGNEVSRLSAREDQAEHSSAVLHWKRSGISAALILMAAVLNIHLS